MKVLVNNETIEINEAQNLQCLIQKLSLGPTEGIALAVNEEMIPRTEWQNFLLKETDQILIVKATAGG